MAEVLVELMTHVVDEETGDAYGALACGEPTPEGTWHGWLEFVSTSGARLRSPRETTQPNRVDTVYWATGLTPVYIEGAFQRAKTRERALRDADAPAAAATRRQSTTTAAPSEAADLATAPRTEAVLDPFSVYQKGGEALLRQQLGALSAWHLVNIAVAYGLTDEPESALTGLPSPVLVDVIVDSVAGQAERPR